MKASQPSENIRTTNPGITRRLLYLAQAVLAWVYLMYLLVKHEQRIRKYVREQTN
jgi:hypothetical protein